MKQYFAVGTYTEPILFGTGQLFHGKGEGLYLCSFENGKICVENLLRLQNPSFFCIDERKKKIYAVNETKEFCGSPGGGITEISYNEMGESGATLYDPYTLWTNGTWQHFYSLESMRHYLTITPRHSASPAASISSIVLSVIGEENVTGIVNVYDDERKATETYDLSGRRLPAGSPQKGLVIRNGKVVFNK